MFTDTHCHISKNDYEDISKVIEDAKNAGITKMINNGSNKETNLEVLELHKKYPNLYPALGFHPDSIKEFKKEDIKIIEDSIDEIVAIGEIGLDYHYEPVEKNAQIELFEIQLKLAEKYGKPVIVHTRDALEDTIKILKKYPKVKGVIHCFTGSFETASIFIKMGYKLGLGGVTTFKNAKIKEVVKKLPLDSFVLETDSPYLSPEPIRGTKNEPKNISFIARFIANERGMDIEEFSKVIEENVHAVFDI